ncbi:alpha-L-fucosidase [uncultured Maribacter sp.]|uniref:alpha-L-fucosidase n=1 Tax=uncultured Maribacter sp. TaxID=431308 RepID=UPI0026121AF1|nr:alpha-L-fucosidase [uncultured Maribacter sp.]
MTRNFFNSLAILVLLINLVSCNTKKSNSISKQSNSKKTLHQLQSKFIDQRFGMFICYNIMSYGAYWGEANYPIESFNPQKIDCNQWAEAAVSAGMKYGLLTTKHHEGFCLWDSEYTKYDVASTPYKKDIVKQYVDAFREKNLGIGLYYSIWDSTHDIVKDSIDNKKLQFIKGQITELLTNYGKVDYFVIDGWFWRIGHNEVPYHEIRELIRELQPECLITDHTHLEAPYHMDIPYFEGPLGAYPPEDNTMATTLGHCSVKGNGWFWNEETPNGMKPNDGVDTVVNKLITCESRYCNFMLNCMPNRDGQLDTLYINMLSEIGKKWKEDTTRKPLPNDRPQVAVSVPIKSVKTSSGIAAHLIDSRQIEGGNFNVWKSDSIFPQTILMDLGKVQNNLDVLVAVQNHRSEPPPQIALAEGNITKCKIYTSVDNKNFEEVGMQSWKPDAKYRAMSFKKSNARYLKLEILEANGPSAIINELEIGRTSY